MAYGGKVLLKGAPTVTMSCLFILISATVLICAQGSSAQTYYGKRIGKLSELEHLVKGEIYAVDSRTIHIKGFSYDGTAPDAYFYAGRSGRTPSDQGIIIPDENGSKEPLAAYSSKDVTLTLPDGLTIKDIAWISIWCRAFAINFGHVMIPRGFDYPRPQKIDAIPTFEHGVSSDKIVVVDAQTFLIPNFYYDGTAPDAFFWVGKGTKPDPSGTKVPDENGSLEPLKKYSGKTIVITLPGEMTVFDFDYLGVWCRAFFANFGHVLLPKNLNVPPSLKMLGVAPQRSPGYSYLSPTPSTTFWDRVNQPSSRPKSPFRHPVPSTSQKTHFSTATHKNEVFPNRFDQRPLPSFNQNPFQSRPSKVSFPDEISANRHRFSSSKSALHANSGSLREPSTNRKIDTSVFDTNPSKFNPAAASHFSSRIQQHKLPINRPSSHFAQLSSAFQTSRRHNLPQNLPFPSQQTRRQPQFPPSGTFRQQLSKPLLRPNSRDRTPLSSTHGVNNFHSSGRLNSRLSNFQRKKIVTFETSEPINSFSARDQRGSFRRAHSNGPNRPTRHFRPERTFDSDLQSLREPSRPTKHFRPERTFDSDLQTLSEQGRLTRHFRPERTFHSDLQSLSEPSRSTRHFRPESTFHSEDFQSLREPSRPTRHFRPERTFGSDDLSLNGHRTTVGKAEPKVQFFDNGKGSKFMIMRLEKVQFPQTLEQEPFSHRQEKEPLPQRLEPSSHRQEELFPQRPVEAPFKRRLEVAPFPRRHVDKPFTQRRVDKTFPQRQVDQPFPQIPVEAPLPQRRLHEQSPQRPVHAPLPQRRLDEPLSQRRVHEPFPQRRIDEPFPQRRVDEPFPQRRVDEPFPQRQELSSTNKHFQTHPHTVTSSKRTSEFQRTFGRGSMPSSRILKQE